MGENIVTSLFNRVVLDILVGFLLLGLIQVGSRIVHADAYSSLAKSEWSQYISLTLVIMAYLLGTLLDKTAYLVFDRLLFAKEFAQRQSSFAMPDWVAQAVVAMQPTATALPKPGPNSIDESGADWISALFLAIAPVDAQAKRRDLVANFQFISNLLGVALLALPVLPTYAFISEAPIVGVIVSIALIGLCLALRSFSVAALRRIHTFENLVVFGLAISGRILQPGYEPKDLKQPTN